MALYKAYNAAMPTTAAIAGVTTGTAIKTLMQLKSTVNKLKIKEWGISFDGYTAATPIKVELVETGTVSATAVTAYVAADIVKLSGDLVNDVSQLSYGTTASGYTSSSTEGNITTTRVFDTQFVAPTNQYAWQFPLGDEPIVIVGNILRVRVTAGTAVNAICWVKWEE